jgi:5-methyltetrahydropteroyltriglutamate--homocysteine methyltransferase
MERSKTRILTSHAGSLPRPPALTALYAARARGQRVDGDAIARIGADAVRGVLAEQIACGLDVINNGEQQRESFVLYLRHRLSGLGGVGSRLPWAELAAYPKFAATLQRQLAAKEAAQEAVSNRDRLPMCLGAISYIGRDELHREIDAFASALAETRGRYGEAFLTAPSPGILAAIVRNEHYASQEDYLAAIGQALQIEYEAIVKAGFLLQIDAPDLALERHGSFQHKELKDFQAFVELVIATINAALVNIPSEQVRLHVCWGNYESPHDHDVPLKDILPLLKKAKVGALYLPFANPRHAHEIRVLKSVKLDPQQILLAGVIDPLTNFVEHPETVADRIERAVKAVGDRERVIAATDCGFDTSAGMGRVSEDVVWAKLRALGEGAKMASARCFT